MIKSMTGFGRAEIVEADRKVVVEMKAVNHRYCDMNIKMPKKLSFFESSIRALLKQYIQRGKVDIFISYEDYSENQVLVKYNEDVAKEYMKYLTQIADTFMIEKDVDATKLARFPDVLTLEEQTVDEDSLWKLIEKAVTQAAEAFVESREKEGEALKQDLIDKLKGMLSMVDFVEQNSKQLIDEYREKLTAKVTELLGATPIDESRIATEIVIYADKICVDEETVRLASHINNTIDILNEGGSVGRKLDFVAQEMNREANTILSKANSLEISNKAIDLKTEIEKVREQIQNIE